MLKRTPIWPEFHFTCALHQEPLNLVCLHEECQRQGLICGQCEYLYHKHPISSLGLILEEILKDIDSEGSNVFLLSQIDNIYEQALQIGQKIKDLGSKKLLLETIERYYCKIRNDISQRSEKAKQFLKVQNQKTDHFNKMLLSYKFETKEESEKKLSNFEVQVKNRIGEFNTNVKEMEKFMKENTQLDKLLMLFTFESGKHVKYQFSPEKKHNDIVVDKLNAKLLSGYTYRIALLDPPIRSENAKTFKKSVSLKIGQVSAVVGVGVCYTKKIQSINYLFNGYSQHGSYLIVNSGYSYNESNPEYNSKLKSWQFVKNDIINVTINPKEKQIQYKKNEQTFEMSYEERPEFEMRFGVLLCCTNEEVEIVS